MSTLSEKLKFVIINRVTRLSVFLVKENLIHASDDSVFKLDKRERADNVFLSVLIRKITFVHLSTLTFNCTIAIVRRKTLLFDCF